MNLCTVYTANPCAQHTETACERKGRWPRLSTQCVGAGDTFPQFSLGTNLLLFVTEFKYLGHMITDNLTDDADMQREVRSLFVRINIIRRRF